MIKRGTIAGAYLALLALSLPIPLLHRSYTDGVIATMRPMLKLDDGRWVPTLMPVHVLLLRSLGQLSWFVPWVILAILVLSFRKESLSRWTTVSVVTIGQCSFTTFYAFYSTWLLGSQWMEWVKHAG